MLEFINYDWKPYQDLRRNSKMKYQQIDNLYATGLAEGTDGLEYTFVPTKKMHELETEILNMYDQIIVENHETQVCDEIFYTGDVVQILERLVNAAKALMQEIAVIDFSEAA